MSSRSISIGSNTFILEEPFLVFFKNLNIPQKVFLVFLASVFMVGLGWLARYSWGTWTIPVSWNVIGGSSIVNIDPINPSSLNSLLSTAGVFFGLSLGAIILNDFGGLDAGGLIWKRVFRYMIGSIGILILWYGLGVVFPREEDLISYFLRYFRYSLVGFWVSGLGPLLFIKLGIAESGAKPA